MKKLISKCFVVMFAMCLPLLAQAQLTTPYFEDFEGMSTNTVPTGWDNSASQSSTLSTTPYYIWGVFSPTSGAFAGNQMIRMYNWGVQSGVACINTPAITLPAAGGSCQLVFKYAHNASCGDFKVKISTDNGTTFTDLATYAKGSGSSQSDPGEFTEATINLNSYLGNTAIIQFWTNSDYGSGAIFVDDVEVGPEPTCFPPTNLQVSDITADEANFSWTASGHNEESWEYLCIPATATPDWSNAEPWSMNQVFVDNLTPNTNYKFYIRSYCSPTDQSKAVSVAFKTLCAAVTPEQLGMITFEQGFNYGSGNLNGDNCWYAGSFQATSTSYIPYVSSSSYSAFDGEGYLQMRAMTNAAGTSRNDSAYAIL
ncbi:MAG: fibronectin type III domain-containing protein, partial [bacterium]|nr:fibronectin type III domain-containing protein [Candidatus Colousia faecequi]